MYPYLPSKVQLIVNNVSLFLKLKAKVILPLAMQFNKGSSQPCHMHTACLSPFCMCMSVPEQPFFLGLRYCSQLSSFLAVFADFLGQVSLCIESCRNRRKPQTKEQPPHEHGGSKRLKQRTECHNSAPDQPKPFASCWGNISFSRPDRVRN